MKKLCPLVIILVASTALMSGCAKKADEPEGVVNSQQTLMPDANQPQNPNLKKANPGGG